MIATQNPYRDCLGVQCAVLILWEDMVPGVGALTALCCWVTAMAGEQ